MPSRVSRDGCGPGDHAEAIAPDRRHVLLGRIAAAGCSTIAARRAQAVQSAPPAVHEERLVEPAECLELLAADHHQRSGRRGHVHGRSGRRRPRPPSRRPYVAVLGAIFRPAASIVMPSALSSRPVATRCRDRASSNARSERSEVPPRRWRRVHERHQPPARLARAAVAAGAETDVVLEADAARGGPMALDLRQLPSSEPESTPGIPRSSRRSPRRARTARPAGIRRR